MKKFFLDNEFIKHVLTLITGSSAAQIIPIAITPILTRIYSPDDFGAFALFIGISSIIGIIVTGRYELAINLPKEDEEAFHLVMVSLFLTCMSCVLLLVVIFIWGQYILEIFGKQKMKNLFYLMPIYILLIGVYRILDYWSFRKKYYKQVSVNRIVQRSFVGTTQLGFSYLSLSFKNIGLVAGEVVGQFVSSLFMIKFLWKKNSVLFAHFSLNQLIFLAKKYQNFPKYAIAAYGMNIASSQVAIILLDLFFGTGVVGFFALTDRVLRGPFSIIGTAIRDVFRQKASEEYASTSNCYILYKYTFIKLIIISSGLFIPLFFILPSVFEFIFGSEWKEAGNYAQIMTPMVALQFISHPLSAMFMISQKQRIDFVLQGILLLGVSLSFLLGMYLPDPKMIIKIFCVFTGGWYILNIVFSYFIAKGTFEN